VRKIKEVLRLKFSVGLGLRAIARSCSIGLGTVHEYLQRAEAAGCMSPKFHSALLKRLWPRNNDGGDLPDEYGKRVAHRDS
jgi:hypothetical protein